MLMSTKVSVGVNVPAAAPLQWGLRLSSWQEQRAIPNTLDAPSTTTHDPPPQGRAGMRLESGPFIERIQILEEEIRELRAVIAPPGLVQSFLALGFTRMQASLLAALMGRGVLSRQQLMAVMYPDVDQRYERDIKVVDTHISYMRKRLSKVGATVSNTWGVGYHLTDESKAKLKALMDRQFLKQAAE